MDFTYLITKYLEGQKSVDKRSVARIAKELNIEIKEFIGGGHKKIPSNPEEYIYRHDKEKTKQKNNIIANVGTDKPIAIKSNSD